MRQKRQRDDDGRHDEADTAHCLLVRPHEPVPDMADRQSRCEGRVDVEKGDAPFANFPCRGRTASEIGPDLFDKLGLKESNEAFDIPDAFLPPSAR